MSNSTLKEEYINFIANEYLGVLLILNRAPLIAVNPKGNTIELYPRFTEDDLEKFCISDLFEWEVNNICNCAYYKADYEESIKVASKIVDYIGNGVLLYGNAIYKIVYHTKEIPMTIEMSASNSSILQVLLYLIKKEAEIIEIKSKIYE